MIYLIVLVVTFILVAILSRPDMRGCRWRMNRRMDRDGQTYFHCTACGAETFTADGRTPDRCLRSG